MTATHRSKRVVVTGLGAVTPCGNSVEETWSAMVNAHIGVGPLTRFCADDWPIHVAAQVKGFDAKALIGREHRRMDLFTQYAVVASEEAYTDAGLERDNVNSHRFGVWIGSGIGGIETVVDGQAGLDESGYRGVSPFLVPKLLGNMAGGAVAMRLGAMGPNVCVATACASGTHALGEAMNAIKAGVVDVAIAGGAEAALVPVGVAGFLVMKALSRSTEVTASRPFDADRDGFVLGEGAGSLVLESLEHAESRGANILAEVVGYGSTCDAHHITAPGGQGAERCMEMALGSAKLRPIDVDYINAHGTSTPINDANETRAIHNVFGAHACDLMVSSTKGVTGHLLGAAGAVEAIAAVRTITEGIVPPTANWATRDPDCDLDYVPYEARAHDVSVVLSNSFGFGGTNATLIFKKL
jgi:3-oxoacyl-[acyl-carrier-protein] synthase II